MSTGKRWWCALPAGTFLMGSLSLLPVPGTDNLPFALAQTADGTALMKRADALAAAGRWAAAAEVYIAAAKAFEAKKQYADQAKALERSATMYENVANGMAKNTVKEAPAPATPAEATPATERATVAPIGNGATPLPLERSAIVHRNKQGALAVANASGRPINGIKLSRHDADIHNPGIVVAPNGVIHVAFVERMAQSPFSYSVYHRSSADGGNTWSPAKNLSEVMPDYQIGNCQIAADGTGRIYVVWRTGAGPNYPTAGTDPHASGDANNLVYRVLEGGAWSGKAIPVHPPISTQIQAFGSASWFVATDPNGKVHVIWNTSPDPRHPESLAGSKTSPSHSPGIAYGDILEATLDGKTASAPQEIYQAKISEDPESHWPRCDNFDGLNGYVDGAGKAHILSYVTSLRIGNEPANRFQIIEDGQQKPAVELPGSAGDYWRFTPRLLVDAQGRRHVITMYPRGEQPGVRDYVIGSDAEPTVIRAAKEVKGKLEGFQAFQGPGGRMVAIMEMNDTGKDTDDELYVSMSSGGKWSAPVNITNNTGRLSFHSANTSSRSHVATESYYFPGPAAATFDKTGHLVLAYVSNKLGIFDSSAFGVTIAGGSSRTPNLLFLRF